MKRVLTACAAIAALSLTLIEFPAAAQDGDWGTVKGVVVLSGAMPKLPPINVDNDRAHCLSKGDIPNEDWVVNPKNKGIRWTAVWLQPTDKTAKMKIHPKLEAIKDKEVSIDQPCCKFEPRVLAMREGQVLNVKNTAPVAHNINYVAIRNESGNVIIPPGGQYKIQTLKADRLPLAIKCDIHRWMRGYVRIYNHPYFAVTDENGAFEIKDAPAGTYRLVSWQEAIGWGPGDGDGIEVTIKGGGTTLMKLELKAK